VNDALCNLWLKQTSANAHTGGHIFPDYAACEAGLESSYGTSLLARKGNNLFGQKHRAGSAFGELTLPTKEFVNGEFVDTVAYWNVYPNVETCFQDRMATLSRLRHEYPHYNNALNATAGDIYVTEVSETWSTDPLRASKVLAIYKEFFGAPHVVS
jgi:flagellum-specific peptidoglycan hydrolase FlgJ